MHSNFRTRIKILSGISIVVQILLGTSITAAGISLFLVPNKIVCGGVSGISTIIYHSLSLNTSVTYALINLILLLLALKVLGWRFCLKTIASVAALSGFIELFDRIFKASPTSDILLATVFGSLLYGLGIGIALACRASTGGTDIIGRVIQSHWPHLPIGKLLLIVDGIIIASSFIAFNDIDLIMYGILALFISTTTIDFLIKKLNVSKLAFVISEKGEELTNLLISTSPRGVTMVDVKGGYTMKDKMMLVCALKSSEIPSFQRKIKQIDKYAFVIFCESQQIVGNGFYVYK